MKATSTAERLQNIMKERNIKQSEIIEKAQPYCKKYGIKLGKNDLSQYVNGKVEPGQKKLSVLALALNVNEAWLMGYDVPRERARNNAEQIFYDFVGINQLLSDFPTTDANILNTKTISEALYKNMEINKMFLSTPRLYLPCIDIDDAIIGLKFILAYYRIDFQDFKDDSLKEIINSSLFKDFVKNLVIEKAINKSDEEE